MAKETLVNNFWIADKSNDNNDDQISDVLLERENIQQSLKNN